MPHFTNVPHHSRDHGGHSGPSVPVGMGRETSLTELRAFCESGSQIGRLPPTSRKSDAFWRIFAPPGAFPQSATPEPCLISCMSRSHRRRCRRGWMGRVPSDSGAHIRCQGVSADILKGFAAIIRVPTRISHQRWSSLCDEAVKSKSSGSTRSGNLIRKSLEILQFPKMIF